MQDLEADLDTVLIDRTTRSLAPTEAGRQLYTRIKEPLQDLSAALRSVAESEDEPSGVLRVLARRSFGMMHVTPMLTEFLRSYPRLSVDLELTERNDIAPGEGIDVVIRLGDPTEKSVVAHRLASGTRILCASPDYLKRMGSPISIEDLKEHACLTYRRALEPGAWVFEEDADDGAPTRREIKVDGPLRATNGEVLRDAAVSGLGLVLLPAWMVSGELDTGRLVRCLEEIRAWPAGFDDEIVVAHRRSDRVPAKIEAFVGALRSIRFELN